MVFIVKTNDFYMKKIDINKLNETVEKAFDRIFEEEDKKEVKDTKPTQWHDDYTNKEEGNVIQTRINPDTKKPEFKIPTNDKVYDTKDAAIAALRESGRKNAKVITINENDIRNMVMEALAEFGGGDVFKADGYRGVSNVGGNEIQINKSGDAARFRMYGGEPTDWMEIEFDEDGVAYVDTPSGREMLADYMRY